MEALEHTVVALVCMGRIRSAAKASLLATSKAATMAVAVVARAPLGQVPLAMVV